MKSARFAFPAAALIAFAACGDPTSTELFDDTAVTADVAASAGDAVASMLGTMASNELAVGGGAEIGDPAAGETNVNFQGTRTCYDTNGAVVANCLPFSSVRMIVTAGTIKANRSSTRTNQAGATVTWTGSITRTMNDTTRRVFNGPTETSRVHTNVGISYDTTTFTDGQFTRNLAETALDSVKALTFTLPRASNPYPSSGSMVRRSIAKVSITKGSQSLSRDIAHRVEVVFPADAQGNVTLKIDAKTCQLNLVTRAVTNCQ